MIWLKLYSSLLSENLYEALEAIQTEKKKGGGGEQHPTVWKALDRGWVKFNVDVGRLGEVVMGLAWLGLMRKASWCDVW